MAQTTLRNTSSNSSFLARSGAALPSLPMREHLSMQQEPPHQPMEMNRGRADSGSTTFSSSSDNTSTSNRSKTSIRRRSHRPRGCRGGSSRKKRRGGKVPKVIMGMSSSAVESMSTEHLHLRDKDISDENAGGRRPPMGLQQQDNVKTFPLSSNATSRYGENNQKLPPQRFSGSFSKPEKASSHPPVLPPLKKETFAETTVNTFSMMDRRGDRSNSRGHASGHSNVSAAPAKPILPPLHHTKDQMQDTNNARPVDNSYALQPQNKHGNSNYHCNSYHHDYNGDNFVDSKSSLNYYPGMEYQQDYYNTQESYDHSYHNYDNHSSNYGHHTFGMHQNQQEQHYYGNYDYDQNYSNSANNINYGFVATNNSYETDFPSFQEENHVDHVVFKNCSSSSRFGSIQGTVSTDSSSLLSLECTSDGATYHTERLEKQRQMMAEGGSLFVTSPRSFLMGWNKDDAPRCM